MPDMPEVLNLIDASWLPVRRRSGAVECIPPWRVNDRIGEDPVIAFDWPRPDFNGAAHELLIGLLSTAAAPKDDDEWEDWWQEPPEPEILRERFARIAHAFDLDGPGPRFLQDLDPLEGAGDKEIKEIAALLIDAPGAQTLRNNADLFVKRGGAPVLSRATAAMALYTLNAYAPSGGAGHRTSLRGGGPMTTLVIANHEDYGATLWGRLWPNVETREQIEGRASDVTASDDLTLIFSVARSHPHFKPEGRGEGDDTRQRSSLAGLLGDASPHPASVRERTGSTLRSHRRQGPCRHSELPYQELRDRLFGGLRTSSDTVLSTEGRLSKAARPSQTRRHQLPSVARPRLRERRQAFRSRAGRSALAA